MFKPPLAIHATTFLQSEAELCEHCPLLCRPWESGRVESRALTMCVTLPATGRAFLQISYV